MGMSGTRAIEKLVEEHYAALYRYAYRLSGSEADADDLVQEAFCKAQSNLGQLRDLTKARGWLFTILRNGFLQKARQRQPVLSYEMIEEMPEPEADELPEIDPDQLQQALNELPELFRAPVVLYYFEDFSYRDIAEQMDLPIGTVMSRLSRAKAYLRSRLLIGDPAIPGVGDPSRRAQDGL